MNYRYLTLALIRLITPDDVVIRLCYLNHKVLSRYSINIVNSYCFVNK